MSSRNKLLNKKERKIATILYRTLLEAKGLMDSSEPPEIEKTISTKFSNIQDIDLLYFKILAFLLCIYPAVECMSSQLQPTDNVYVICIGRGLSKVETTYTRPM